MADQDVSREDKKHPASERRLRKARDEGRVARSRDLGHFIVLGTALLAAIVLGPSIGGATVELVRAGLRFDHGDALSPSGLPTFITVVSGNALWVVLPFAATLSVAAILATFVPGGLVLSLEPLQPKASKLSPMNGIKRIFSLRGAMELAKLIAIAASLAGIGSWFVADSLSEFASLAAQPLPGGLNTGVALLGSGLSALLAVLFIVACVDVPFQWSRHRVDLRMTDQEVKQEHKESEGDPMLRGRIRARQREAATRRMLGAVPAADVIITNPTHYAVAIRYNESSMGAPRVVAKGADLLAARIREIAREANVPLFEAPPLARALYAHVELDHEIPAALYAAVAQVLAYVYQLRHWVPGRGAAPRAPAAIDVPAGLDPQIVADGQDAAARPGGDA